MTFIKVGLCLALGFLLYNNVDGNTFFLTYATMIFLFILNKNINIRGLVIILSVHIFVLYESLYATYYLTKYGLETGKLIGDMSHNFMVIICYVGLLLAIYYREEVTKIFYKSPTFTYMPTKADLVQIAITKLLLLYHILYTLLLGYLAIHYTMTIDVDPVAANKSYDLFSEQVWLYREYSGKLGAIKIFSFSLLMVSWSAQRSGRNKPAYEWT